MIINKDGVSFPKKQRHLQHDECSRYSISTFDKTKDAFIEPMSALCKLSENGMAMEYIQMGNSGENKKMVEHAWGAEWKLTQKWEFTVCSTPQQNCLVEVEFTTIAGHARAMCNAAHMSDHICIPVASKVLKYSTALSNVVVDKDKALMHYQLMHLQNPKWA
jgi:hypothetical protein